MKIEELKAESRSARGSASARRLRAEGKVPGVLYGHGQDVVMLAFDQGALQEALGTGHQLVTLNVGGRQERALVKEVQFDTWGREILHVDLSRVALDETVTVNVEIVGHGTPKAILAGNVLEQPLHRLEVACKADAIPDAIRVEVGDLEADGKIHVRDLKLPEGVRALVDPDTIVFVVKETHEEVIAPAPAAEAVTAEPEVIGRAAKEEEEEPAEEGEKKEKKE
jgi:large subunit ribosomal protein L25